jgi:hypothetical protein
MRGQSLHQSDISRKEAKNTALLALCITNICDSVQSGCIAKGEAAKGVEAVISVAVHSRQCGDGVLILLR